MTTASMSKGQDSAVDLKRVDGIVAELEENGVWIEPGVITTDKADEVGAVTCDLREQETTDQVRASGHQRIGEIAVKHCVFRELLCHPLVLAVWRRLLGVDMVCSTWSSNTLYPGGGGEESWHADHPFWAMQPPYPTEWLAGQTIWMLDDLTQQNGATGYLPHSHLRGCPPENQNQRPAGAMLATGTRGSVVFGHGAWWHSTTLNNSDRPRTVLLGMYIRPIIIPMEDMRGQLEKLENSTEIERQIMGGNQRMPANITTPPNVS